MRLTRLRIPLLALALIAVGAPAGSATDANPEYNGKKLSEWEDMLRMEQNARLRRVALVSMGQIASDNALDSALVRKIMVAVGRALKMDNTASVRRQAAEVVNAMAVKLLDDTKNSDTASVILDLSENLRVEKDTEVRREVAVALGRFGDKSKGAATTLADVLTDKDPATRAAAADALGRIGVGARAAADALILLLKDADKGVRAAAIFALGRIDPEEPAKVSTALVPLVKSEPDVELRRAVVVSLGILGDRSPATVLGTAVGLQDADVDVRRQAAIALAKFTGGGKLVEKELKKAFEDDKDKQVRGAALRALCEGFGSDAKLLIPTIVARLKVEPEFDVRIAIIEELSALGADGKDALPALREAQKDPQTKIREAAAGAIKRIMSPKPKT